jgi:hypothetical protein
MANKKNTSSDEKLKATLKQLRGDLKQSETKRAAWKKRATKAEKAVADLRSRLQQADKQARKALKRSRSETSTRDTASDLDSSRPGTTPGATTEATPGPDASWTVAQLRAEARRRGLTGLSNKPKSELLEALTP